MRYWLYISALFFIYSCGNIQPEAAQQPEVKEEPAYNAGDVKQAAYDYNAAVIAKDTAALNMLLHDKLSYGHSNGWQETKEEQIANLFNGTITYHRIEQPELKVIMNGDVATVRGDGMFDVDYKETEHMLFDLNVMQTWVYEEDRWQMLNRQSIGNKK